MTFTLLFGNNFIQESPKSVKFNDKILFLLNEDSVGPYITAQIYDWTGDNLIVNVQKNICTYCSHELVKKYNERNYILINNNEGENILQSRVLDKETILVSGLFSFKEFVLLVTQNYIVLPSGKRMMYNKVSAKESSVKITDEGIEPNII
jgi:hypothetical protein